MKKTKLAKSRKSQVWSTDFILSTLIFIAAVLLSVKIITNSFSTGEFDNVYKDASLISEGLLSDGYPTDWDSTNVIRIGIATNSRINENKLQNLTKMQYQTTKTLLSTRFDYYFYFKNINSSINISGFCGYGSPEVPVFNCTPNIAAVNYQNLVKINRFAVYNSSIIEMELYVWNKK